MNKKMKKLGLLVVSALAMTMGVNSANALQVGQKANNYVGDVTDNSGHHATITQTAVNNYTIDVVDSLFDAGITIYNGETVTINLNGKTLASEISNNGTLTFVGNSSSYMVGTLYSNASSSTLIVEGGNYARMVISGIPKVYYIRVVGTVFPSTLKNGVKQAEGFKYVENADGTITVLEADASLQALVDALNSTATHGYGYYFAHEAEYTKSSFAKYKEAYEKAQALRDENRNNPIPVSRKNEIKEATDAYIAAVKGLKYLATDSYAALDSIMSKINAYLATSEKEGWSYTDAILAKLNDAVARAYADMDLPTDKATRSNKSLDTIIGELKQIYNEMPSNHKADYSKVNALESVVAAIGEENYTAESYAVYKFAQDFDRDLPKSRQYDVNNYYAKLLAAANGLKLAENKTGSTNPGSDEPTPSNPGTTTPGSDEPSNPGTTNPSDTGNTNPNTPSNPSNQGNNNGGNNNSSSTVNPNTDETGTTSDVNTRDNVVVYAVMNIASLIALAGCGLVLRKQN